ncbi:MAG: thiamine pyrophosphate-dependent enzyme, partial [Spirochaetota bacterium]
PNPVPCDADRKSLPEEVRSTIAACRDELIPVTGIPSKSSGQILSLLQVLRSALPDDGVFVTDMTTPAYTALSEWPVQNPAQFLHPVGFGALGYALPTAVGIKSFDRERKVLVLAGDGGFQFTMQELAVALEQRLGLPIVIWNNRGYGEIRRTEDIRHPGQRIAVDVNPPEFQKLANAYGADYARFESKEAAVNTHALSRAVQAAFAREVPTLIEIIDTQSTKGATK